VAAGIGQQARDGELGEGAGAVQPHQLVEVDDGEHQHQLGEEDADMEEGGPAQEHGQPAQEARVQGEEGGLVDPAIGTERRVAVMGDVQVEHRVPAPPDIQHAEGHVHPAEGRIPSGPLHARRPAGEEGAQHHPPEHPQPRPHEPRRQPRATRQPQPARMQGGQPGEERSHGAAGDSMPGARCPRAVRPRAGAGPTARRGAPPRSHRRSASPAGGGRPARGRHPAHTPRCVAARHTGPGRARCRE